MLPGYFLCKRSVCAEPATEAEEPPPFRWRSPTASWVFPHALSRLRDDEGVAPRGEGFFAPMNTHSVHLRLPCHRHGQRRAARSAGQQPHVARLHPDCGRVRRARLRGRQVRAEPEDDAPLRYLGTFMVLAGLLVTIAAAISCVLVGALLAVYLAANAT